MVVQRDSFNLICGWSPTSWPSTAASMPSIHPPRVGDSMADFFESTLAGIRMAAKAGKSRHALRNIAAFASRAYPGIRSPNNSPSDGKPEVIDLAHGACRYGRRRINLRASLVHLSTIEVHGNGVARSNPQSGVSTKVPQGNGFHR
jgi:hypothetical protein